VAGGTKIGAVPYFGLGPTTSTHYRRRACYHFATQLLSTEQDRAARPMLENSQLFQTYQDKTVGDVIAIAELQNRCSTTELTRLE
jgi:hypothetical protein